MRSWAFTISLCTAWALAAWAAMAQVRPPLPEPIPDVLFMFSGVSPEQSAGQAAEKGYAGLVLPPSTTLAAPSRLAPGAMVRKDLALELDGLQKDITVAGLRKIFLAVSLDPDTAYFESAEAAHAATEVLAALAQHCGKAQCSGILLDTIPSSLFYDFRWDGYVDGLASRDILTANAHILGHALAKAFFSACPAGELLITARGGDVAPAPLWLSLLEGVLTAAHDAEDTPIHVLLPFNGEAPTPPAIPFTAALREHLAPKAWRAWQECGRIEIALQRSGGPPSSGHVSSPFVTSLLRAKLMAHSTICLMPSDAPRALDGESPAPPMEDAKTPLDSYSRAGILDVADSSVPVLRNDSGAAAVLWPGQSLTLLPTDLPASTQGLVSRIQKTTQAKPDEPGPTVTAEKEPLLVSGLRERDWLLPACLWMDDSVPVDTSAEHAPLVWRFDNHAARRQDGTISVVVHPGLSVNPETVALALEPGQTLEVQGRITGTFANVLEVPVCISVTTIEGVSATRAFTYPVAPPLAWKARLDGAVAGRLAVEDLDGDACPELLVCTDAGELACMAHDGGTRWMRRFPATFDAGPVVAQDPLLRPAVITLDRRGRLRACSPDGRLTWEKTAGRPTRKPLLTAANLAVGLGSELLICLEPAVLQAFTAQGDPLWKSELPGGLVHPPVTTCLPREVFDTILVACREPGGTFALVCLDSEGQRRWQTSLKGRPVSAPFLSYAGEGDEVNAMAVAEEGCVQLVTAKTGAIRTALTHPARITCAAPTRSVYEDMGGVLMADKDAVYCYTGSFRELWRCPLPGVQWVSPAPAAQPSVSALVGAEDHAIIAVSREGEVLWRDARSAFPVDSEAAYLTSNRQPGRLCVYASRDRVIRAISLAE